MTAEASAGQSEPRAAHWNVLAIIARHCGWGLVTLLLITLVTFFGSSLKSPTELAKASLGQYITPAQAQAFIKQNDLDRPVAARYVTWLGNIAHGDLGTSVITHRPVTDDIMPRLYRTLILTAITLLIAVPIGLAGAVWSARRRGRRSDISVNVVAVVISACPEFVIGIGLLLLFGVVLKWLPVDSGLGIAFGSASAKAKAYVLPTATLVIASVPFIMRTCRATVSSVLAASYVRAATLRGVSRRRATWTHAMRNAAPTVLTAIGLNAVYLLSGVIVVENVFDFPGLGQALVAAVGNGDTTTVQAIAILLGTIFVLISLVMDGIAAILNPRARSGAA